MPIVMMVSIRACGRIPPSAAQSAVQLLKVRASKVDWSVSSAMRLRHHFAHHCYMQASL